MDAVLSGSQLGISGWVLTNNEVGDVEVYADVFDASGSLVESYTISRVKEMGENTFAKNMEKTQADIMADKGYEYKDKLDISSLPLGEYRMDIRIVDPGSGLEEVINTANFSYASDKNIIEIEDTSVSGTSVYFVNKETGVAFGYDEEKTENQTASPNQIIIPGWVNGEEGTNISLILYIDGTEESDGEIYDQTRVAEQGGSITIERVPRNLQKLDEKYRGGSVGNMEEGGYIAVLNLPFLSAGNHRIGLTYNVTAPGQDPELVDLKPFNVVIDPAEPASQDKVERIKAEWEAEMPKPTATPTPEPAPEGEEQQNTEGEA